jgi:hypothetical protein
MTALGGQSMPLSAQAAVRKPRSNGALCATMTLPRANSMNRGSTSPIGGAPATISSVMPVSAVMSDGIGVPGLTSAENSLTGWSLASLTAPISVILAESASQPVVSTSTTTRSAPVSSPAGSRSTVTRPPGRPRPLGLARPGDESRRRAWSSRIRLDRRVFHKPDADRRSTGRGITGRGSLRRIVTMSRYGQALTSARRHAATADWLRGGSSCRRDIWTMREFAKWLNVQPGLY